MQTKKEKKRAAVKRVVRIEQCRGEKKELVG